MALQLSVRLNDSQVYYVDELIKYFEKNHSIVMNRSQIIRTALKYYFSDVFYNKCCDLDE